MPFQHCSHGMVVGPHPFTAEAGLEVLQAGGNAFDAAVAAAFTEAVVMPSHNGVAGYGGTAVCYVASEGRVACIDYNTEAPEAARPDMFLAERDGPLAVEGARNLKGALSVGVPGIVAGLDEIHRSWGTLPAPRLLASAIRAAREGWPVNRVTVKCLRENADAVRRDYPGTAALIFPDGEVPDPGDRLANPELGDILEQLAVLGLRDFYEGEVAVRFVTALRRLGGIVSLEDMAAYQARHVDPVSLAYRGHTLHTPPVGAGGVTTLQILAVLEGLDLAALAPASTEFFHLFAETMKVCWRQRLQDLGDPTFGARPEREHLQPGLIEELRQRVRANLMDVQPGQSMAPDPSRCTSHICVADVQGNVVSLTQTHGAALGSYLTLPGTGLLLGHGMGRFDPRPGWPNSIAARKRPLHNMAPMLVLQEGRPTAAYGTPGGRTIVNNQALFTLGLFAWGLELEEVLALPRLHCEDAEPMKLEARAGEAVFAGLRDLGHQVTSVETSGGPAHGLLVGGTAAELRGASDPRYEGRVAGA